LLEIAIKKVHQGYKKVDDTIVKPKKDVYSLDDIIDCLESDSVLHSKDRGYKPDSIRALVSRFEAAKSWGIFTAKGTPLSELSCEGQLTVIDTSFLEDNVTALVIGILARRVLSARKMSTRKEAAGKFKSKDVDQMLEFDIPPTWLFIDEAHTLIPSGNVKTPATAAIVEYVKQGRRPGCSMVFATQQPSAIDTKVLSQLDIMIAHKLVFDDDIKAVYRRVPTIVPAKYKRSTFIKTLPIGTALIADRSEETSRAFIMKIRPRMSQHEGRDAETTDRNINLKPDEVKRLMIELIMGKLNKERSMPKDDIGHLVETLNTKYKSDVSHDAVITGLVAKGAKEDKDNLYAPDYKPEEAQKEIPPAKKEELKKLDQIAGELIPLKKIKDSDFIDEDKESMVPEPHITVDSYDQTELYAIPVRVNDAKVQQLVNAVRKKRALGMFGSEERIEGIDLKYSTIWKVTYDSFNPRGEFVRASAYIDGDTGELLHFANGAFVQSRGLEPLSELGDDAGKLLRLLTKGKFTPDEIIEKTKLTETRLRSAFEQLYDAGFMDRKIEEGKASYWLKKNVDLPPTETHPILQSIEKLPVVKLPSVSKQREKFGKEEAITSLKKLWPNIVITTVSEVFRPFYYARLSSADGKVRTVKIDAFTGTISG
jgi:hypothetical protein